MRKLQERKRDHGGKWRKLERKNVRVGMRGRVEESEKRKENQELGIETTIDRGERENARDYGRERREHERDDGIERNRMH